MDVVDAAEMDGVDSRDDSETPAENSAKAVAERVLEAALSLDQGRPGDDSTVLVVKVETHQQEQKIRRMELSLPI